MKITYAIQCNGITIKLVRTVSRVNRNFSNSDDLHSVFQFTTYTHSIGTEHNTFQRRIIIF